MQCHSVILQQQQTTACPQCAIPKIWSFRRIRNTLYPRFGPIGVSGIRYTQDLVLSAYPEYAIPKIWSCRCIRKDLVLSAYPEYAIPEIWSFRCIRNTLYPRFWSCRRIALIARIKIKNKDLHALHIEAIWKSVLSDWSLVLFSKHSSEKSVKMCMVSVVYHALDKCW